MDRSVYECLADKIKEKVPMFVSQMKRFSIDQWISEARDLASDPIFLEADYHLYGKGNIDKFLSRIAQAIAILSFSIGGVEVFGEKFESSWKTDGSC